MSHPLHIVQRFGPPLTGLVHVGANVGQELNDYVAANLRPVLYVEAHPDTYRRLAANVEGTDGHIAANALCAAEEGLQQKFFVASNDGNSSSMLDFGWHTREHPEVTWTGSTELTTRKLDSVVDECERAHPGENWRAIDALVLDVQGAEMHVLRGASRLLERVRCIWSEVNYGGLYQGDCSVEELQEYLRERGFIQKHIEMGPHGWGDALFIRET